MKSNWIRLLAGALVSVVLVGAFALTGGMKSGKSTEGILYQASGLHPDGQMLVIDGQTVTCEEYLRWLDYTCAYLTNQLPDIDWSAAISDSEDAMTYGEYAKVEAVETVKSYAVIRAWAEQANVTLGDEAIEALAAQRAQYVALYGEEGYQQQLALMGISEETFDNILATQYLLSALRDAYAPGGSLYDQAAVDALIDQQRLTGVYVITLTGDNAETMAADLLERWQAAEDKDAEYQAICDELQQEAGGVVTLAAVEGDPLSDAIMAMELEELATAIDPYGDGTCYVLLRTAPDQSVAAEAYFQQLWEQKLSDATVVSNAKLYNGLDVADFCSKLSALRTEMAAEISGSTQTDGTQTDGTQTDDGQTDDTGDADTADTTDDTAAEPAA